MRESYRERRKKKQIKEMMTNLQKANKKLDNIIEDNKKKTGTITKVIASLKNEIKILKKEVNKPITIQHRESEPTKRPKTMLELQREGGGKIDPISLLKNDKLKQKLNQLKSVQG